MTPIFKSILISTLIFVLSIIPTTSDVTDICPDGIQATTSAGSLEIGGILCSDDNRFYLDIEYMDYDMNAWFGIVFADTMVGEAAVYTTGKDNDLTEALYAYTNTDKTIEAVNRNTDIDWIEEYNVYNDTTGLRIVYSTSLASLGFTLTTESIPIGYAIGTDTNGLDITGFHLGGYSSGFELSFATPSPETGEKGCDKQDLVPATTTMDSFTITFFINCDDDTVTVTIQYDDYNNNWFGIVFNDRMFGPALVYTTGKSGDTEITDEGLYPYNLDGKIASQVVLDADNFWTEKNKTISGSTIIVTYQQDLDNTEWSRETETVSIRWAYGTSLTLVQHSTTTRSVEIAILDLLTGTVSVEEEDKSMEIAHGVLMWLAWAVLASIGIFSSAFRDFLPKGPIWFKIHRGVQASVVIIDIIAFIIAIVFTARKDNPHFANAHMIIGLVVTILSILQPINALFRAHPPKDGWPNGEKPTGRIVWECIHKGFGYITWILGCVAIMLGLLLLDEKLLAYLHMFLWCGLLLIMYIIFKIVLCLRSKQADEVGKANTTR